MKKKANLKKEILATLKEIVTCHPEMSFSVHIMMATQDYPDIGILTDTAFLYELDKYKALLELDDSFHIDNCEEEYLDSDFYAEDEDL